MIFRNLLNFGGIFPGHLKVTAHRICSELGGWEQVYKLSDWFAKSLMQHCTYFFCRGGGKNKINLGRRLKRKKNPALC